MKIFSIELPEGSTTTNLTMPVGTAFPSNPNGGELFFRSDLMQFYVYDSTAWQQVAVGSTAISKWTAGTGNDIYRLLGNVGIGTSSPTSKLHVSGQVDVSSNKIINVSDPTSNQDAATKNYVDTADLTLVSKSGSTMTGFLTLNADPTNALHAATKQYVDNVAAGLDVKKSVRVATTANINLASAPSSIDGVTLTSGDRVLVKDQTTASQNGIYDFNGVSSAMTRSSDADNSPSGEVTDGMFTFVQEGTTLAGTGWVLTTNDPITLGSTSLTFTQFSEAGVIQAGSGLTKTGTTLSVNQGSGSGLDADTLDGLNSSAFLRKDISDTFAGSLLTISNTLYANGNVGIGTSAPASKLNIMDGATPYSAATGELLQLKRNTTNSSASNRTAIVIGNNSNTFTLSYGGTSDRFSFTDGGGIEGLTILNGGKVGINKSSPDRALDIDSTGNLGLRVKSNTTTSAGCLYLENDTGRYAQFAMNGSATSAAIQNKLTLTVFDGSTSSDILYVNTTSGKFGFNDSNPLYNISIKSSASTLLKIENTTASGTADLVIKANRTASNDLMGLIHFYDAADAIIAGIQSIKGSSANKGHLYFSTSGTERLRIDESGQVGIGTSTPGAALEINGKLLFSSGVNGVINNANSIRINIDSNNNGTSEKFIIGKDQDDLTSGNELFVVEENGSVGIGTSSPVRKLHLNEPTSSSVNVKLTNSITGSTTSDGFDVGLDNSQNAQLWNYENTALIFGTNNTERMRVTSDGNVAIGDNSASAKLFVRKDSTDTSFLDQYNPAISSGIQSQNESATNGSFTALTLTARNSSFQLQHGSILAVSNSSGFTPDIVFSVSDSASTNVERMRIDSNGNVGIGTNSPATLLDVDKANGSQYIAHFKNNTAATPYTMWIQEPASPSNGYPLLVVSNNAGTTDYLRVDSGTGRVGIGTGSPTEKLHVNGGRSKFVANSEQYSIGLARSDYGNSYYLGVSAETNPSLIISNNAGTERVRISDSGDLGIATTGRGIKIAEGSNAKMGVATLVAGTVTVNTTAVSSNSRIFLTGQNSSGTHGELTISARTASTSFTITSSSALDTRDVAWIIFDPA